jgi:hypothetical protein
MLVQCSSHLFTSTSTTLQPALCRWRHTCSPLVLFAPIMRLIFSVHGVSGRFKQTLVHIKLPCRGGTDWSRTIRLFISVELALQAGTGGKGVTAHYSGPPNMPRTPPQHSWEFLLDVLVVPLLH